MAPSWAAAPQGGRGNIYIYIHTYTGGLQSSRNLCTEEAPKESNGTRCCVNTICPPEDEHSSARNM